jgi:hypothetical protein
MATVNPSGPHGQLRGKVGGMVYALQPDGTITVRSLGQQTAESTEGEQKGQHRMQLGHRYVHGVLGDPALRSAYDTEAQTRKMRTCDMIMSDFLTNPVISSIDTAKYNGRAGGWLLVITGDDFKVVHVGVVFRNAAGQRIEEGFAIRAQESSARVWTYTAENDLALGQNLTIEVTATDRPGHSSIVSTAHPI